MTLQAPKQLPEGLAPARPLRDRQAERRRALDNSTNIARVAPGAPTTLVYTDAGKGVATHTYEELAQSTQLTVVPKPARMDEPTAMQLQRRAAANAR